MATGEVGDRGEAELYAFLARSGVAYERVDHPPVYTCEEAERLVPAREGAHTKNLFLRDRSGRRHFLVVTGVGKQVDLKGLSDRLSADRLSFGSRDRLVRHLGVEPGGVSLFGLVRDTAGAVEVVIDRDLWTTSAWRCHPLVNTTTLIVPLDGIRRFLAALGRDVRLLEIPVRATPE